MTVADCLRTWKGSHDAAKQARYRRNLADNALQLAQARQSLLDAHALDPDHVDPTWSLLPCSLSDLATFYDSQLSVEKVMAPRFAKPVELETTALAQMQAGADSQPMDLKVH